MFYDFSVSVTFALGWRRQRTSSFNQVRHILHSQHRYFEVPEIA